jgi:hypothetical protein
MTYAGFSMRRSLWLVAALVIAASIGSTPAAADDATACAKAAGDAAIAACTKRIEGAKLRWRALATPQRKRGDAN